MLCTTNCYFAVIQKAAYKEVIEKIETKNKERAIAFLNELPFFRRWSKSALSKLLYATERLTFARHQSVIREGD